MIKTKLQTDIQNEVDIKDITDKLATISAKASSSKYKGNVTISFTVDSKVELSSIITNKNLGTIATNGVKKPTADMIKTKLQTDIQNEVDIKDITDKLATISAKTSSSKYKGNVTISFTVDSKVELSSIITNKDLGTIITNGAEKPTEQMIKEQIKNKNSGLDINAISISNITTTSALVKGDNVKYKGNVNLNYIVDKSKFDLYTITDFDGLPTLNANSSKSYNDLRVDIVKHVTKLKNVIKDPSHLLSWVYKNPNGKGDDIYNKPQEKGDIWIYLKSMSDGAEYLLNQTALIKITLN